MRGLRTACCFMNSTLRVTSLLKNCTPQSEASVSRGVQRVANLASLNSAVSVCQALTGKLRANPTRGCLLNVSMQTEALAASTPRSLVTPRADSFAAVQNCLHVDTVQEFHGHATPCTRTVPGDGISQEQVRARKPPVLTATRSSQ